MTKAAALISALTNPKWTFFVLLLYVAAVCHESIMETALLIGYSIASLIMLSRTRQRAVSLDGADFTDPHHRRTRYLTFGFLIALSAVFLFLASHHDDSKSFERRFFTTVIITTSTVLLVTYCFRFKLSAHTTFLGLQLLFIIPDAGFKYTVFLLLGSIVGWARIQVRSHSPAQILSSMALVLVVYSCWDATADLTWTFVHRAAGTAHARPVGHCMMSSYHASSCPHES